MRTIEFTEDFAGKAKGDKWTCDGQLASQLVREDKVAKYVDIAEIEVKDAKEVKPKAKK